MICFGFSGLDGLVNGVLGKGTVMVAVVGGD